MLIFYSCAIRTKFKPKVKSVAYTDTVKTLEALLRPPSSDFYHFRVVLKRGSTVLIETIRGSAVLTETVSLYNQLHKVLTVRLRYSAVHSTKHPKILLD